MVTDLKAYKAGILDKKRMGDLMRLQMASFSEADMEAVAAYISGL